MDLHVLFLQRKERYEEEYAPEAIACWDEYSVCENHEGFVEDIESKKKDYASEAAGFALIRISIDGNKVREMCLQQDHKLDGDIKED